MGVAEDRQVFLRPAAAIILMRGSAVWLGRRGNTRFLPGFWVFPGGGYEEGESPEQGALRELQEETGLALDQAAQLHPFARAITPAYSPIRYDARFYRLELPEDEEPTPDGKEFLEGRWFDLDEALDSGAHGRIQLAPPTVRQLCALRDCLSGVAAWPTPEEAFSLPPLSEQEVLPMADGVTVVPVRSPALPPAAWTNCVLLGRRRLYVVDPGGRNPVALKTEIVERVKRGAEIAGVILTHHHSDHVVGYPDLEMKDVPIYCHRLTAPLLPEGFPAPVLIEDQETLPGDDDFSIVAHWTPGHAPGHLALEIPQRSTLFAADLLSSLSSIVIPSDNGDLADYLNSLQRMRALNCRLVIPAHGPSYGEHSDPFGQALAHRDYRERQILTLLDKAKTPLTMEQITEILYLGLHPQLVSAARANVLHHLKKLRSESHISHSENGWTRIGDDSRTGV